jgi:SAM-dependent methyltransferase
VDGWTREQLRHVGRLWRFSSNPAATVYDSIGADFFLAPAPGWLNLGLWQGAGDEAEAAVAPRRLVEVMAARLPRGGVVLDVGNGLGVQDPVIAEVAMPHALIAINITESQLRAGRSHLADAGVHPVVADATRIPLGDGSVDAVISVEAAFHFTPGLLRRGATGAAPRRPPGHVRHQHRAAASHARRAAGRRHQPAVLGVAADRRRQRGNDPPAGG